MESLGFKDVDKFLVEKLGLSDWQIEKAQDPLGLIRSIVYKYITHPQYAFQNLTMASNPPAQRSEPTKKSSIAQILSTLLGMCIEHNYFLAVLFKSIGYDTFIVGSTVTLLPMPLNHPLCVVRLDGGLWLIDMGMGSVFHEPVPLHQLPMTFDVGGFKCQYREVDGGLFQRVHITGDPMKGIFKKAEEVRYHFTLQPRTFEDFSPAMVTVFTDEEISFFLNHLYSFRYINLIRPTHDGSPVQFNAVTFIGTTLVRFSEKDYSKTIYDSYEDMESDFVKYFPQISNTVYKNATQYFGSAMRGKLVVEDEALISNDNE